ncbi:MAG: twin-arginine translocase TatA/TatE family subunit [Gammaproteobacteria bacterium]|jgi:sec-independent protein translocase protein TatA
MGSFSIWHWLIVLAVVLILFGGGGKLSRLMGDFGKGLKSFKKQMKEEGGSGDNDEDEDVKSIRSDSEIQAGKEKDKAANG